MPIAGPAAVIIVRRIVKQVGQEAGWSPEKTWWVASLASGTTAAIVGLMTAPVTVGVDGLTGGVTAVIDAMVDAIVDPDVREVVMKAIEAIGSPGEDGTYAWSP
jgi:hypothetical protein